MNRPPPSTPAQQNEEGCSCAGCLLVPLIPLYFGLLAVFFIYVVPAVAGVAAIVAVLWILYRHGVALKSTIRNTRRIAGGDEPAIQQYFYGAAWDELRVAAGSTNQSAIAQCGKTSNLGKTLFREKPEAAMVPLGIACYIVLAVSAPVAYVALGVSIVLHATVVIVCVGVLTIVVGVLRSAELVSMVVRRIYLVCPNRDCHQRIALPIWLPAVRRPPQGPPARLVRRDAVPVPVRERPADVVPARPKPDPRVLSSRVVRKAAQ